MKASVRALGRLKTGTMNATEREYASELEALRIAGQVAWYKFEGVKLRLADNTFLTVDFAVMLADGTLEMHDVKGSPHIFSDDAKVKMKVAAELYPFVFKVAYPISKKQGGGFKVETYGR